MTFTTTDDDQFTVGLRVIDDGGAISTDSASVTVLNVAPTANAGGPYTMRQGADLTVSADDSSDPGNDIAGYEWDLDNDGQFDDAVGVTTTFNSSVLGEHTIGVKVVDDDNAWSAATSTIQVTVNQPPVATDKAYSVDQETTLAVPAPGVLTGDSDVNGDALTALLVSGPSHGALTLNTDGSFLYAPNGGFVGLDSFAYQAHDGEAVSNVATSRLPSRRLPILRPSFTFH